MIVDARPVGPRSRWLRGRGAIAVLTAAVCGCALTPEDRFQRHIDYLASDALEGRGVGSTGIELASEYIAGQFASIGLEPAGEDGTYFQTFPLTLHRRLTDASRLAFSGDPAARRQGEDFIPFGFSFSEEFSGGVVFCGYGIVASDRDHDDFASVDVAGKAALMLDGEPSTWADEAGHPTRHAMLRNKVYNAKDRGAVAALIVNATPAPGQTDRLTEFVAEGPDDYGIPAFHVARGMVEGPLARAGLDSLDELQEGLDGGERCSAELPHAQVSGQAGFERTAAPTRNVLGIRRGRGPLADEWVVLGAHYDHLGIRKPGMRKFKDGKLVSDPRGPEIHNGADDNASGTSGLIEIARMFASQLPTSRSLLFIAFTAEESGLHGSKFYVENPAVLLEQTVAMLNMDMIGRMKPGGWLDAPTGGTTGQGTSEASAGFLPSDGRVQVFGADCGTGLRDTVEFAARSVGLRIVHGVDEGGRSDHASFLRKNVPSLHFFSGNHSDYHQPTDDSDKINSKDGVRIARLVHRVAHDLASRGPRPEFQRVKQGKKDQPAGTPTYRVVMGLSPGYADDGQPGMAVDAVSPDGPADLAGMKAGDRIIRVNDKPIANIYDYMAATRNNNPGDTVEVAVLRGVQEHVLRVTLAGTR